MQVLKTVLLLEDLDDDVFFFRRAMKQAKIAPEVIHMNSGQRAIDYLLAAARGENNPRHPLPDFVFVDLKLPGVKSGFDVLEWIQEHLRRPPPFVWVLSSSNHPQDRKLAQALDVDGYTVKPITPELFEAIAKHHGVQWARPPG